MTFVLLFIVLIIFNNSMDLFSGRYLSNNTNAGCFSSNKAIASVNDGAVYIVWLLSASFSSLVSLSVTCAEPSTIKIFIKFHFLAPQMSFICAMCEIARVI